MIGTLGRRFTLCGKLSDLASNLQTLFIQSHVGDGILKVLTPRRDESLGFQYTGLYQLTHIMTLTLLRICPFNMLKSLDLAPSSE